MVSAPPTVGYGRQLADCRQRLRGAVSNGGPQLEAMAEEGKLLRATLVLASGSPLGASDAALLPAAVSIELLHLASLVHDDIIDEATERRGAPALHVTEGRDRALVLGDLLIVAAFAVIGELRDAASADAFAGSVEVLSRAAEQCCLGQLDELDPRDHALSEDDYLDLVAKKTGALFAAAAALGALAAGADSEDVATLAALGTRLGMAYQIRDDLRDGAECSPTSAAYARAVRPVLAELERLPASCRPGLRDLVDAMLGSSVVPEGRGRGG